MFTAKKKFASKSSDGSTFELRLIEANQQPEADFYVVRVNAAAQDSRYFVVEPQVEVKVTTSVNLADVQVGVADRDQTAPKLQKVEGNNQLKLDGDQQSKLFVKFSLVGVLLLLLLILFIFELLLKLLSLFIFKKLIKLVLL